MCLHGRCVKFERTHLEAPWVRMTTEQHLTSDWRCCVHHDSIAALRVLVQMLSELLKLQVSGVSLDTYVVALALSQSQVVNVHKVVL